MSNSKSKRISIPFTRPDLDTLDDILARIDGLAALSRAIDSGDDRSVGLFAEDLSARAFEFWETLKKALDLVEEETGGGDEAAPADTSKGHAALHRQLSRILDGDPEDASAITTIILAFRRYQEVS